MRTLSIPALLLLASLQTVHSAPKADSAAVPAAARAHAARIVYLEGEVFTDGVPAEIGRELGAKASFKTGENSFCDLVFGGRNAVRIGKNTEATIDFSRALVEIDLKKGGMTSVLRKLEKISGDDSFRVRMKGATAGVRGTSFCVWQTDNGSYVCACNGTVRTIDSQGGNEFTLTAAHHVAKIYTADGGYVRAEAAGMLHHTDQTVESLAARIGETIDWSVPD